MRILLLGNELFRVAGQRDMTKLRVAFRNFPNAPQTNRRVKQKKSEDTIRLI